MNVGMYAATNCPPKAYGPSWPKSIGDTGGQPMSTGPGRRGLTGVQNHADVWGITSTCCLHPANAPPWPTSRFLGVLHPPEAVPVRDVTPRP